MFGDERIEMYSKQKVLISDLVKSLHLEVLTRFDYSKKEINNADINRPGIQITGYFKHYDSDRVQIIGFVEADYMNELDEKKKECIYRRLLNSKVPGVIFCRSIQPDELFIQIADSVGVPVFKTDKATTAFMSEIIKWLSVKLAPVCTIHGCLADVYGTGVLITGESGIGKSEAVLELIKRGHRLISDDAVEIHKVSDSKLYGNAPKVVQDYLEIRGIGIVDVKLLYGIQAIKETQDIDVVVTLEEWDKNKEYDRLGEEENYIEILGNKVMSYRIPIRPGRNLAVILEAVAINWRSRMLGYNAVKSFLSRVSDNI